MRGGHRHYTYSRLMSWVAVERAIRIARQRGLPGDIARWSAVRDRIFNQIMERGWHRDRRAFVQHYDGDDRPTGEQLGNFPQAFTHPALISAPFNLDRQLV